MICNDAKAFIILLGTTGEENTYTKHLLKNKGIQIMRPSTASEWKYLLPSKVQLHCTGHDVSHILSMMCHYNNKYKKERYDLTKTLFTFLLDVCILFSYLVNFLDMLPDQVFYNQISKQKIEAM